MISRTAWDPEKFGPIPVEYGLRSALKQIPEPNSLDLSTGAGITMPFRRGLEIISYVDVAPTFSIDVSAIDLATVRASMCRWAGYFWSLYTPGVDSVRVEYRGQTVVVHRDPRLFAASAFWCDSWAVAWTFRSNELSQALLACGARPVLEANRKEDSIWQHYVGMLGHLATGDEDVYYSAHEVLMHTDPKASTKKYRTEHQEKRAVAELVLALHADEGHAAFNKAYEQALLAHRQRVIDLHRESNSQDFFAWVPMGIAALAHDRGVKVEVESDYAPLWMVRGAFALFRPHELPE